MSVSAPTSHIPIPSMETILPHSVRERHCGIEDLFRYLGGAVSFGGAIWCLADDLKVPGILLTITGVTIVIVHITEKNCGVWAKAARAGERVLQSYKQLILAADQTAVRLQEIQEEQKHNAASLEIEHQALLSGSEDIEQGVKSSQDNIEHIKLENDRLHSSNQELQKTIEAQATLIQSIEQDLQNFTTQNNRLHKELESLSTLITSLQGADTQMLQQTSVTTAQFQEGLGNFEAKIQQMQIISTQVQQMHQENLHLQTEILQLHQAKDNLTGVLQSITRVQSQNQESYTQLLDLTNSLEAHKAGLVATEHQISVELAEWKKLIADQATKDLK